MFHVKDFEGPGNSYSAGIGGAYIFGGSTNENVSFSEYVSPSKWGQNKNGYTIEGGTNGIGLDVGVTLSRTHTVFFNKKRINYV
ncbi:hypothetical protein [Chryseobacterium sp. SL1]|uniref:hypothetical protein n=1 Tax=Chryseobacterium sp. SL1 TaxID=2995159 RepID=UPI0022733174|nr:hypothetical protein [Chryseobacterium sp. SL1]MCY1663098.1 hypothetical protein [Chryseobacterium sp. SL1]